MADFPQETQVARNSQNTVAVTTPEDLSQAGLIAAGNVLQFSASREAGMLRALYNQGAKEILAKRAAMEAANLPENVIAKTLADMRYEHAMKVRSIGSAMMRHGAELIDRVRGQARPTYESLRAAGKTDAQIIASAAKTNGFVNKLPSYLKWSGRSLWFASAGISVYLVMTATPGTRDQVLREELNSIAGGALGGAAVTATFVVLGAATAGWGYFICLLVGSFLGSTVARKINLLEMLEVVPHRVPSLEGELYVVSGDWKQIDLLIVTITTQTVDRSQGVLAFGTGMRSPELFGGRGHYHDYQVVPASPAAVQLFGGKDVRYVPRYLLQPATAEDLRRVP